jgi:hypothetical protein
MARGIWREKSHTRAMTMRKLARAAWIRSDATARRRLTQVLNIFIGSESNDTALLSCPHAGAVCLVDYDTICDACRQEGGAVGEGRPSGRVVESNVRQAVSQGSE